MISSEIRPGNEKIASVRQSHARTYIYGDDVRLSHAMGIWMKFGYSFSYLHLYVKIAVRKILKTIEFWNTVLLEKNPWKIAKKELIFMNLQAPCLNYEFLSGFQMFCSDFQNTYFLEHSEHSVKANRIYVRSIKQVFIRGIYLKAHCKVWDNFWQLKAL